MTQREFAAYIECLPAQDRLTVQQALHGLRDALGRGPDQAPDPEEVEVLDLIDVMSAAPAPERP